MRHSKTNDIMKQLIVTLLLITLFSCKNSETENLQVENQKMKFQIEQMQSEIHELEKEKSENIATSSNTMTNPERGVQPEDKYQSGIAKRSGISVPTEKHHEESEALKLVSDYYDFYNAEYTFRNARVRRISSNKFQISVEECFNKKEFVENEFHWRSVVRQLTIHDDGSYKMSPEIIM